MMCRAVIFDFNGTLSDDEPILFQVFERLFAEHGRPMTLEQYRDELAGLSDPEIVRTWLGERDDLDEIVEQRLVRYREIVTDGSTIGPDTRSAVRWAAQQVPLAIVSGAALAEIQPVVQAAGLDGEFLAIVSSDDVVDGKPHPEGYLAALKVLAGRAQGLQPDEVTVFEDTEAGVASAKAAGMRCIAVAGTLPRHRLAQADEIVEAIDEPLLRRIVG
jgi:beta-phosphoglucomutase-like phosphatase (HAD superfamily)